MFFTFDWKWDFYFHKFGMLSGKIFSCIRDTEARSYYVAVSSKSEKKNLFVLLNV